MVDVKGAFIAALLMAAVAGWVVIEVLLWFLSKISFTL